MGMAQIQPYYPGEVKDPTNQIQIWDTNLGKNIWYYTSNHYDSCSTKPDGLCLTFVKGFNLWQSDGTPAGTHKIRSYGFGADAEDGGPGTLADDAFIAFNNSLVYIGARDPYSFTIEKIDNHSTTPIDLKFFGHNRSEYYFNYQFTQVNNLLYFVANDDGFYGSGNNGTELWKTDGTPQGTVMVKDIRPGSLGSKPNELRKHDEKTLYFTADDGTGYKLWKSDGTEAGTVKVVADPPSSLSKQWDKTIGGNAEDRLSLTIATSDNGYLLAGTSYSGISGDKTQASKGNADYWIIKTDANGNKLWDKTFGTPNSDALTAAIQTSDGGYLLGGYTNAEQGGDKSESSQGGNRLLDHKNRCCRQQTMGQTLWRNRC
jgi:ELWxxDGT repeat protein